MQRRAVVLSMVGVLAAVVFVAVATSGDVPLAARAPTLTWEAPDRSGEPILQLGDLGGDIEIDDTTPSEPATLPEAVGIVVQVLGAALAVAIVIALWNNRPRLKWRRPAAPDEFDLLDEVAAALAADAQEQRSLLQRGAARNAIVSCWLRLEKVITEAGLERRPADTAQEFASRVLSEFEVDPSAVDGLAALYLEARFSSHDMTEHQRGQAITALDNIHAGLAR